MYCKPIVAEVSIIQLSHDITMTEISIICRINHSKINKSDTEKVKKKEKERESYFTEIA